MILLNGLRISSMRIKLLLYNLTIDFYPSITKKLPLQSINLARDYTDITQEELDIILACGKSILVYNNITWEKKTTENFDVTTGSFDSAKIVDLEGIYI